MRENHITHPGMITVDGRITWYTPDELVAAMETDILVSEMSNLRNEWQLPIEPGSDEYREIYNSLREKGLPGYLPCVIAEYVRRTGEEVRMNIQTY